MSQYIINSSQNQCKTVLMELLTLCACTNFLNSGVYFALGTALLAHRGTAAVVCQVARNHKTMVAALAGSAQCCVYVRVFNALWSLEETRYSHLQIKKSQVPERFYLSRFILQFVSEGARARPSICCSF